MNLRSWLLSALLVWAPLSAAPPAAAAKTHTVQKGQRLGSIAKRYRVSIEALCTANNIRRTTKIFPGDKLVIPERGDKAPKAEAPAQKPSEPKAKSSDAPGDPRVHVVARGQRLASIAKRYRVSVDAICTANDIDARTPIKPGQRLLVPDASDADGSHARRVRGEYVDDLTPDTPTKKVSSTARSWAAYKKPPKRRGYVTLSGMHGSYSGYAIGRGGRVLPAARQAISRALASGSKDHLIDARLVKLIAKVSDTFGGRPLRVVSGFRSRSYSAHSRHPTGHALDFSIPGIPNEALRDYLHTLPQVGVGYYPNSSFVHLDVRETFTTWVDDAGPGEAPRYR